MQNPPFNPLQLSQHLFHCSTWLSVFKVKYFVSAESELKKCDWTLHIWTPHTKSSSLADSDNLIVEAWKNLKGNKGRGDQMCRYTLSWIKPVQYCLHFVIVDIIAELVGQTDSYDTILSCCCVQCWTELLSCCSVHFLSESVCALASFSSPDILESQQE